MAIDTGERRVGVAICDARQVLATPLSVLTRRSKAEDFQRLGHIARENEIVGLLVGLPLNADGSAGTQARQAARYGHRLASSLALPVILWDEYGSSQEAARRLAVTGRRSNRAHIDAEAAAIILQDYLNRASIAAVQGQTEETRKQVDKEQGNK
ncbi:MAG: Holliday junction resolvase RuvX [Chloroflexota bacterium]|nr:Holliday junction resolvase RuvX [Chloroflexota bacterium]